MMLAAAKPDCPRCGGTGWLVVADGGAGAARACPCRDEFVVPNLIEASGIPPRYRDCTLDRFDTNSEKGKSPALEEARAICKRYVESFLLPETRAAGAGLLLFGGPGAGKTHLAAAVLLELIRRYREPGRFVDFTSLVHQIQSTFDPSSSESKHQILDPVVETPVLVLDELGAQKSTPWVNDLLYLVLNTRYTNRRPTLFTTNFRPDAVAQPQAREEDLLSSRIAPMLLSRLYEMSTPVSLEAEDYRKVVVLPRMRA